MNRVFIEPNFAASVIGATVQSYFVGLVEQNQRNSDTDMIHARYLRLWDAKKPLPDKGGGGAVMQNSVLEIGCLSGWE